MLKLAKIILIKEYFALKKNTSKQVVSETNYLLLV